MNTKPLQRRVLLLCAMGAMLFPGCLEHEVTTTVNTDGSCERVISIKSEGEDFPDGAFPIALDSSWDTSRVRVNEREPEYRWTLKKHFDDYEDLTREYARMDDPGKLRLAVHVEKRFRWFYTYFEYREVYARHSRYNLVPPSAVMTADEILRYTYGDSSAQLKSKVEEWEARNLYEILYRAMMRGAANIESGSLAARLEARKEDFFRLLFVASGKDGIEQLLASRSSRRGQGREFFRHAEITDAGIDALTDVAVQAFESDSLALLKDEIRAGWKEMESVLSAELSPRGGGASFTNTVVVPGVVLETGAPEVKGNSVSWKFTLDNLALHDYEMRVESRTVNVWAIVVSGLLVFGLLILLLALPSRVRARRRVLTAVE